MKLFLTFDTGASPKIVTENWPLTFISLCTIFRSSTVGISSSFLQNNDHGKTCINVLSKTTTALIKDKHLFKSSFKNNKFP